MFPSVYMSTQSITEKHKTQTKFLALKKAEKDVGFVKMRRISGGSGWNICLGGLSESFWCPGKKVMFFVVWLPFW